MVVYLLTQGYGDYREVGALQNEYRRILGVYSSANAAMSALPREIWQPMEEGSYWNGMTSRSIAQPAYVDPYEVLA